MIFGPWDEEFVVVSPGQTVEYKDFTNHKSYSRREE
jgi:rRNA processing protein Gar1